MKVVCNSSPIINLSAIQRVDLLNKLYGDIFIPQAVYDEITIAGAGEPWSSEVRDLNWIKVKTINNKSLVKALTLDLDNGEAESIALAEELPADLILIDERKGRIIAQRLGKKCIGTLGILIDAKNKGYISNLKPELDNLILKSGFYISDSLYNLVSKTSNEL
ncbi:MAG: DUF3368 domain-containing protein [Bacteroidetes bacterium]|nr:DUF3368 domain-containing protein [Bacteroidota bacterium]MBU2584554.1 DUF3368 domain-containing protein [Bacteroidota bacterium]